MNPLDLLFGRPLGGLPYIEDPHMPLTFVDKDGIERPLLCRRVGDVILIHPVRLEQVRQALTKASEPR